MTFGNYTVRYPIGLALTFGILREKTATWMPTSEKAYTYVEFDKFRVKLDRELEACVLIPVKTNTPGMEMNDELLFYRDNELIEDGPWVKVFLAALKDLEKQALAAKLKKETTYAEDYEKKFAAAQKLFEDA